VLVATALAMAAFVSVTQRWFLVRNRWYESVALILVCFTLFRPAYWLDRIDPPFIARGGGELMRIADATRKDEALRLRFESERGRSGKEIERVVRLTLGAGATGDARIRATGLVLQKDGEKFVAQTVRLGSQAFKLGVKPGDEVAGVLVPAERASPYWFMLPALLLLGLVVALQWRRKPARKSMVAATAS